MFKNLSNLTLQRNWKEDIGFYIAYLLLSILLGAIAGGIMGVITPNNLVNARMAGLVVATIYCLVLYYSIYIKKKLSSFLYILLGLVAGLISLFIGNLVSLIFVAILTTQQNKNKEVSLQGNA